MATRRKRQTPGSADPALLALEEKLGHTFANPALLELALTHRSHTYEARHGAPAVIVPMHPDQRSQRNPPGTDNEQLEFLGDSVIGFIVTEALFREFPLCSEGELTRLRSNLVSRTRLAEFAKELGLGEILRLGRSADQNGGREKRTMLANAMEALLAAIYLDVREAQGNPIAVLQQIAETYLVQPELAAMREAVDKDPRRGAMRDHKTLLQERVQATGLGKVRYIDVEMSGPPHLRVFTIDARLATHNEDGETERVLATALGGSKKEAQQRAAELALALLDSEGHETKTKAAE
jgi:ribonuclease-3